MKANIEIDCPLEARQFFGLPDVAPMQTAVMDKLLQQVLSNIEKISVVNWQTCLLYPSERAENTEMHFASHLGLGVNPAALWAVADRLAQPEGEFWPFDRAGPFTIAYAPPGHTVSA
jgi:hypothetical protein